MAASFATKEATLPRIAPETLMQEDLLENALIVEVQVTRSSTAQRKDILDQEVTVEMINVIIETPEILVIIGLEINIHEVADINLIIREIKEKTIDIKTMIKTIKEIITEITMIKMAKAITDNTEKENTEMIKDVITKIKIKVIKI